MRPLYLTISGWGPYKDLVEIDFEKLKETGLFLITGPTGAGKTTIFDAISYALYGNLSGDMREKGTVRSDFAAAEVKTFVKLTMEHDGKIYEIERNPEYLRPKKRKSGEAEYTTEKENAILRYPDGKVIEGMKEVNAKLLDILVLDYNQFKQISMLAQGQFSKLLNAGSKEKVAIFREIFGTHIFDRFTTILRGKVRLLEEEGKTIKHKLEEALRILADRPGTDGYEEGIALREWMDRESIHYQSVEELLADWQKSIAAKKKELENIYDVLDASFRELSAKMQAANELDEKFRQLEAVKIRLASLIEQETQVQELQKRLADAMAAAGVQVFEVAMMQAEAAYKQEIQKEALLKEELLRLQNESEQLQVFGIHGDALASWLEAVEKLDEMHKKGRDVEGQLAEKERQLQSERETYLKLEKIKEAAKSAYDEADKAYKRGMVGIVASTMLEEGKPCPVCGSLEHPTPAGKEEEVPTEQRLEELGEESARREKAFQDCYAALMEKQAARESLAKEQQALIEQINSLLQEKEKWLQYCMDEGLGDPSLLTDDLTLEQLRGKQNRFARMAGLIAGKEEEIGRNGEAKTLMLAGLERRKKEFTDALSEKGFINPEAYKQSILTAGQQEDLQKQISKYQEDVAAARQLTVHLEAELKGKELPDAERLKLQCQQAKEEREAKRLSLQNAGSLLDAVKETKDALGDKLKVLAKIEEKYGYVKDLEAMAGGKNSANLVFEQYVLAGYFDEILRAANMRFSKMTGGRYEMARMEETSDARKKDSLEIEVMDYYTGKARPIKTLSGGESFKASLSLALGLSDVIQAMSGGIKVDVLFVDEGFGALDGESLDQACETMQSLVEHNRMIGIISHVQELRERISNQIVVERTSQGSSVRMTQ